MEISIEDYKETQAAILGVARLVFPLPLDAMLNAISRSETVGPFVDPTLWREGSEPLARFKALVVKLRAFQAEVQAQLDAELAKAGVSPEQVPIGIRCPDCGVRFREGKDLFSHACQTGDEE
jgi:hypothetical protein